MLCLRRGLQKHQVTRKLVGFESRDLEQLSETDKSLRSELAWQQLLSSALESYTEAVTKAFNDLLHAQETLESAGIRRLLSEEHPANADASKTLMQGIYAASSTVRQGTQSVKVLLQSHVAMLSSCLADVEKADEFVATVSHYEHKLESLEQTLDKPLFGKASSQERSSRSYQAKVQRIERNRKKLNEASQNADIAQTEALESLKACSGRRGRLCRLAQEVLANTAEALRCTVPSSNEEKLKRRSCDQFASLALKPDPANPFDEDVRKLARSQPEREPDVSTRGRGNFLKIPSNFQTPRSSSGCGSPELDKKSVSDSRLLFASDSHSDSSSFGDSLNPFEEDVLEVDSKPDAPKPPVTSDTLPATTVFAASASVSPTRAGGATTTTEAATTAATTTDAAAATATLAPPTTTSSAVKESTDYYLESLNPFAEDAAYSESLNPFAEKMGPSDDGASLKVYSRATDSASTVAESTACQTEIHVAGEKDRVAKDSESDNDRLSSALMG
eukprot:TRINITY_DN6680_c0_g1_i1.p1 TRINITY_DN6680_c0_g1~~TRINITY_DN6680_c0_g1_i1.p1  ORF type:complete len:504 (+),score=106.48 TRINITY_DN6680_c0_g1_i1:90-1601(+)